MWTNIQHAVCVVKRDGKRLLNGSVFMNKYIKVLLIILASIVGFLMASWLIWVNIMCSSYTGMCAETFWYFIGIDRIWHAGFLGV